MSTSRRSREPWIARSTPTRLRAPAGTPAANATWFDLLTAAAFLIFREAAVEWAVVEVGLGGRLDSTNIVDGEIAVVTNIALEHTEILGHDARGDRAREGRDSQTRGRAHHVARPPTTKPDASLQARADELDAPVVRPPLDAAATIEDANVALAAAVARRASPNGRARPALGRAGRRLAHHAEHTRLAARLPGRMERFDLEAGSKRLPVVMDGAHVPFNIGAVLRDLALDPDLSGPCVAIVALAADKDAQGFVAELGQARLDHHFHRFAGIEPGPPAGRASGARAFAWAHERGRAGREARAQARP